MGKSFSLLFFVHCFPCLLPHDIGSGERISKAGDVVFIAPDDSERVEGTYGTLSVDGDGGWTYDLEDLPSVRALDEGDVAYDVFSLKVAEPGSEDLVRLLWRVVSASTEVESGG